MNDTLVGQRFGEYEAIERLSGGKSGPVYKARHCQRGQIVTLKLLPAEAARRPEVVKRFRREVSIGTKLDHPNLLAVYDAGVQDGLHYLVMEYYSGTDLAAQIEKQGPLDIERAVDYVVQSAEALEYLHSQGIVHRNIKPHNLVVDARGKLKVANLLLARLEDNSLLADPAEDLTKTGEMLGSVDYLAPEQAADASRADHRADTYALGCTLFHMLVGRPPYTGKSSIERLVAHRSQPVPSLLEIRPDVPPPLDRLCRKMMAKRPENRPKSMRRVIRALQPEGPPRWLIWLLPVVGAVVLAFLVWLALAG